MRADVERFVKNCSTCRRTHVTRDRPPGLLHPLPVPDRCWQHVSFDFKSFPTDRHGYDNVFVVVDRLGKRAFSLPCNKTVTAAEAARLYYTYIWRIYGAPETATSDRGPQFVSGFMDELCKLTGVKQKLSSAWHPQTDGNTEVLNQYIDQRLRPFVNYYQNDWSELLPCMDFVQATMVHESIGMSPFELELGWNPRQHFDWEERSRLVAPMPVTERMNRGMAQQFAKRCHDAVQWAKKNVLRAQERQSVQANKHRRPVDFDIGDSVYVKRKNWTSNRPSTKLDYQNIGPYKILERVGYAFRDRKSVV